MGVLCEDGAVGTDVHLIPLLVLTNGRDTAGGKTGGTGADELRKTADKLKFGLCACNAERLLEEIGRVLQVLKSVLFDLREETGIERIGLGELAGILALEH
ncbi:Hexokinase [Pyrenophora tritici-repentis]|nr:Hexokinase [Pyrenophora tritici-repentis]